MQQEALLVGGAAGVGSRSLASPNSCIQCCTDFDATGSYTQAWSAKTFRAVTTRQ